MKKIVIAEDDDAIAHMASMALGDAGFLCIRGRDGEEALQLTKLHQPDVLVLDIMMPGMDGRDVARKLKADVLLSRIPILMLTALSDVDSKVAGLEAGADDYMSKPFELRELAARVRALIRSSRREGDRNNVSELPGSYSIDEHIASLLAGDEVMAVLQIAVPDFSQWNEGMAEGETLSGEAYSEQWLLRIKALANLILSQLRKQGGQFLGHLGGADFVATCRATDLDNVASAILTGFGAMSAKGKGTNADRTSVMLIGCALATAAKGDSPLTPEVLSKRLALASLKARSAEGSNYVLWSE